MTIVQGTQAPKRTHTHTHTATAVSLNNVFLKSVVEVPKGP